MDIRDCRFKHFFFQLIFFFFFPFTVISLAPYDDDNYMEDIWTQARRATIKALNIEQFNIQQTDQRQGWLKTLSDQLRRKDRARERDNGLYCPGQ